MATYATGATPVPLQGTSADNMAVLQPVLGELAHDLSLPTLARASPRLLDRFLDGWVQIVQRHTRLALGSIAVLTLLFGYYSATHIAFNADPNSFFSQDLRFQQAIRDFEEYLEFLKARGIFTIARITVYQDQILAKVKPEWAVHLSTLARRG